MVLEPTKHVGARKCYGRQYRDRYFNRRRDPSTLFEISNSTASSVIRIARGRLDAASASWTGRYLCSIALLALSDPVE